MSGVYNFSDERAIPQNISIVGLFAMKDLRFQKALSLVQKYPDREMGQTYPLNHLLDAAIYVSMIHGNEGSDDDRIIALLHDSIDDGVLTFEYIEKEFGAGIADCVKQLSGPQKSIQWILTLSEQAQRVTFASKMSNIRSVALKKPDKWTDEQQKQYIVFCRQLLIVLQEKFKIRQDIFDEMLKNTEQFTV